MMIIEEKIKDKEKQEDNQPSKGKVWCHVLSYQEVKEIAGTRRKE